MLCSVGGPEAQKAVHTCWLPASDDSGRGPRSVNTPPPHPLRAPETDDKLQAKGCTGTRGAGRLTPPRPGGAALLSAVLTPPPSRAAVAARRRGSQRYLGFGVKAAGGSTRWDPGLP